MEILSKKFSLQDLGSIAQATFGDMVKAVVDVDRELVAINAELHSDLEALLLKNGSKQAHLWGINLYPEASKDDFIEFDSMINVRPSGGNRSRSVENETIRKKIAEVVQKWITQ
jgi:hypothetical protein